MLASRPPSVIAVVGDDDNRRAVARDHARTAASASARRPPDGGDPIDAADCVRGATTRRRVHGCYVPTSRPTSSNCMDDDGRVDDTHIIDCGGPHDRRPVRSTVGMFRVEVFFHAYSACPVTSHRSLRRAHESQPLPPQRAAATRLELQRPSGRFHDRSGRNS